MTHLTQMSRLSIVVMAVAFTAGYNSDKDIAPSKEGAPAGELVVFAAASLNDAFGAIAKDFGTKYPGVDVKLNFAGSQSLRTQIENGAQPQVFASANAKHIKALHDKQLVDEPTIFVHNELVIVAPAHNPVGISALSDLPKARRLVVAGPTVPAGSYTETMLDNASSASSGYGADFADRVKERVVSQETHVRQALQKVLLGEADAAIVYATDAASVGNKVKTIPIPRQYNVIASYPMAAVSGTPGSHLGQLFIEFVLSDVGRARLTDFGFRPADAKAEGR